MRTDLYQEGDVLVFKDDKDLHTYEEIFKLTGIEYSVDRIGKRLKVGGKSNGKDQ